MGKVITFELHNFYLLIARSQWTSQVDGQCLQLVGEDSEAPRETRYDCDFPLFFLLRPPVTWLSRREILIWPCVCSVCLYSSPIPLRHSCPFSAFTYLPSSPRISLQSFASVPGCWHNTDGPGSGEDVILKERCLLWDFHWRVEAPLVFLLTLFCSRFFPTPKKLPLLPSLTCAYRFLSGPNAGHTFPCCVLLRLVDFSVVFGTGLVVL